jgi:23S rRNA (pseudouridine1915-N3)-methyltransferase
MKISIFAIGKINDSNPEAKIIANYMVRMPGRLELRELEIKKNLPPSQLQQAEGELLLEVSNGYYRILMDEKGKTLNSNEFADFLDKKETKIAFLIGGAHGHAAKIRQQSNMLLSLSAMTMPHMLARAILIEQIYRAYTINSNHPYHK